MSAAEQLATLKNRILELEQENKRLHESVEYLTRKLYGRSTEKTSALSMGQVSLFDEAEIQADRKRLSLILKKYKATGERGSKDSEQNSLRTFPMINASAHWMKETGSASLAELISYLLEKNSFVPKSNIFLPKYGLSIITVKPLNAGLAEKTGIHTWRSHRCRIP
jgi:hypothetical protein